MKTLRDIFGNLWGLLGIAAYAVSLAVLWRNPSFGHEDAVVELIIFGLGFPLLAWVTTLRVNPLAVAVRRRSGEMLLLVACLIGVTLYLVWGTALSETLVPGSWLASPRAKSEISGVALMSLLFGLAHAPGFIFRRAGLAEAIGENPLPIDAWLTRSWCSRSAASFSASSGRARETCSR